MILHANLALTMEGFFKLDVYKLDGKLARTSGWFRNIITNTGLDMILNQNFLSACRCGTGNATPAATDTVLGAQVAGTTTQLSNTTSVQGSTPYYASRTIVYQFGVGAAAGNIAEVGVAPTTTSTNPLFSRALVLDGGGSPTTITVLSDEYLQVTYQFRVYPPLTDVTGSVTFNSTTYSTVLRAAGCGNINFWQAGSTVTGSTPLYQSYSGALGAITSQPATLVFSANNGSFGSYTNGNYYIDITCTHTINSASTIQCGYLSNSSFASCQWSISPTFSILNTQQLQWVIRYSWARGSH